MDSLTAVEARLATSLADILDVPAPAIARDAALADLGVDSIVAVQWVRALKARHGIDLRPTALFDHPSIQALARHLASAADAARPTAPPAAPAITRRDDRIAIVGMAGQFPMARTVADFWANIAAGRDCVSEIPPERWPLEGFYDPDGRQPGRSGCKWMGVLEDVDRFDPAFFSLSPAEAEWMDPQQRLFLQQCWSCLEDAGLDPLGLAGARCGLFVGGARIDYGEWLPPEYTSAHRMTGTSLAMLSARVAYTLNLTGPCLTVDTASSSSLVAIAQACDSLLLGRSDLALAGGAAVLTAPSLHIASSDAGMLSRRGRCYTFEARADGFVPAEAVGVLLLKRLDDALRDGHEIHAVIRGWGVNQDGKTNGITAPSAASQTRLQQEVYERFAIDPATISLIEAHGTGTSLGDPIEIDALRRSFGVFTQKRGYCVLGSAKASIGHALAAAGVVGVIKSTLALKHRLLPPLVHFETLNPQIALDDSPFVVNTTLRPWETMDGLPRRVAVNGFGFGGTNAHVVLEEYRPPADVTTPSTPAADTPSLIVLSARTRDRLTAQAQLLLDMLDRGAFSDAELPDLAFTLQTGRHAMRQRLGIVAHAIGDLRDKLRRYLRQEPDPGGLHQGDVTPHEDTLRLFNADEDTPTLIDTWIRKGRYDRLLELWVKGLALDWTQLHRQRQPRRRHLPTYPFAGERYWIPVERPVLHDGALFDTPSFEPASPAIESVVVDPVMVDPDVLATQVLDAVTQQVATVLRMKAEAVEAEGELSALGFDSISLIALAHALNHRFGVAVTPPIFFEHSSVRRLSAYLVRQHAPELTRLLAPAAAIATPSPRTQPAATPASRARSSQRQPRHDGAEPLAVIGISGSFPGAADVDALWQTLAAGRDGIGELPGDRWDTQTRRAHGIGEAGNPGTRFGGFMDGIADFDPLCFGISPREAEIMDPQQRLILTHVWKALEDAGYAPHSLAGSRTALFVGMSASGYDKLVAEASVPLDGSSAAAFLPSIGPNRASYFFDLHGPSEPIETACSSSLVALHRAALAFEADRCDLAIVGGVNVILNAARHAGLGKAGILSPDGRCRTFSARANGYVRGEGVAMVLLKRLREAERDGDHIYAVMRGSAENHGGRSNSLTAPSPLAQTDVIKAAWTRAGVDPRSATYIEAHGTGTSLGDPIEINALKQAFAELIPAARDGDWPGVRCGLGSIKTNIGHLEMAAGIAGVIKVILQLQHRTLVPSLHCDEINPYIQLDDSRFFVVRDRTSWPAPANAAGIEQPRRAGISSFGFGGVNAHIVLEEYRPSPAAHAPARLLTPERPAIVVLSAASAAQVEQQAEQLLTAIGQRGLADADLANVAFTLQVGREAMNSRLGIIASSISALRDTLRHFLAGRRDSPDLFVGDGRRQKIAVAADVPTADDLTNVRATRLLEQWVAGASIAWDRLYDERNRPRRISLPTYPFVRERCWVPAPAVVPAPASEPRHGEETFHGHEPLVADHLIDGSAVLASALQLDLAWRALAPPPAGRRLQLRNVAWLRPLVAGGIDPLRIAIRTRTKSRGDIGFEVVNTTTDRGDPVVHAQGTAVVADVQPPPCVDMSSLRAGDRGRTFMGQECYDAFGASGITYGPAYRAIETLQVDGEQALGRLRRPAAAPVDGAGLSPAMLDAALQCAMGRRLARAAGSASPAVLFALDTLTLFDAVPDAAWAWVRPSAEGGGEGDRFDVDLIDDAGRVCVRLQGVATRPMAGASGPRDETAAPAGLLTLVPVWEAEAPPAAATWPGPGAVVAMLGGVAAQRQALREQYPDAHLLAWSAADSIETLQQTLVSAGRLDHLIVSLADDRSAHGLGAGTVVEDQRPAAIACFRVIKALLASGYGSGNLGLTVLTVRAQAIGRLDAINPAHAAVHGLIGSLAKELRGWHIRLVDLDEASRPLMAELLSLPPDPDGNAWLRRAGLCYRRQLLAAAVPPVTGSFVRDGVYVIVGGAGGVGVAVTEYLVRHYQARVVWIGRRPEDEQIRADRARLQALGPAPRYVACDATDTEALARAWREITSDFPRVHGLIHAAVVIDGEDIARTDEARFVADFSAKAAVCTQLARVCGDRPPDVVLFFSSIQSFENTARHSYYAAGSNFADAFARQLAASSSCDVRVINWGYWRGVTHVPLSASLQHWLDEAGMGTIDRVEACAALEALLASPLSQVAFLRTTRPDALQGTRIGDTQLIAAAAVAPSMTSTLVALGPDVPSADDVDDAEDERATLIAQLKQLLLAQLQSLGLLVEGGPAVESWTRMFGMLPLYDRWLTEAVRLVADGAGPTIDPDTAWQTWTAYTRTASTPYHQARTTLIETMMRALPDILCGVKPATDVMFPRASLELVEGLYTTSRLSRFFNQLVARTVVAYLEARRRQDPSARVRILEIGAGTGATSAVVFDRLRDYRDRIDEYCYTDISPVFLTHAERTFGAIAPFLRARTFDVTQPAASQGLDVGRYDLVIAANVLHATPRMRDTLRHAKSVLKAHGWLIANELTRHSLVAHLTFGLLKGWWLYEDEPLRIPGSPLLSPDTWRFLLDAEGFRAVTFPARDARSYGQQVIVAESDGLIRRLPDSRSLRSMVPRASALVPVPVAPPEPRPEPEPMETPVVASQRLTEYVRGSLIEELSAALKIEPRRFDPEEPLANYGVDSIVAVQTVDVLNERFGIALTTTSLFDHSSIDRLTTHILSRYGAQIAATVTPRAPAPAVAQQAQGQQAHGAQQGHGAPGPRWSGPRSMARPAAAPAAPASVSAARSDGSPPPIAIIGMSARFPNVDSVEELWEALAEGRELTSAITRWSASEIAARAPGLGGLPPRAGFLRTIDRFDPLFFSISGLEATYMDPQQRLFLEEAWKALEDAGYAGPAIQGRRCGVYVGYNGSDYARLIAGGVPAQALWGNVASVLSARIAYHLDLQGPAITIDSACSSSLVATHLACQALWAREVDCALAGGVYVQCTPAFLVAATRAGMLSPNGRCHTFDARADGFVPGEGVGVIMLKRLDEAMADGDQVIGVIRGSGINQDGATSGITAPSAVSQERLERDVYDRFGIRADRITMVEAHGTGTRLGDPIEFQALTSAFRRDTDRTGFCALGSIKTNIGHTTAAAGIAGVIKVLLSLRHRQIPPSLHYERPNPHLDLEHSPFYVNTTLRDWTVPADDRRRAAISAFGLSGTNAHLVIEEPLAGAAASTPRPASLIVLSAQTAPQLREQAERLLAHCTRHAPIDCGHVSFTLLTGRRHLSHRLAAIVRDSDELVTMLRTWIEKGRALQVYVGEVLPRDHPHQASLVRYGNQCLATARDATSVADCQEALDTIADLFVQGYALEYSTLFTGLDCRRISLPTYPFARDRYWIPVAEAAPAAVPAAVSSRRHPLLHEHIPDDAGPRYRSTFSGEEFFLADHVVNGVRILPGMACLEMARAAAADARRSGVAAARLCLQHVAFAQPLRVTDDRLVAEIALNADGPDDVRFDIAAVGDAGAEPSGIACQGRIVVRDAADRPRLDVEALRARCEQRWSGETCYARFAEGGLAYGPAQRGLERVAAGVDADGVPFVLADVALPSVVQDTQAAYELHPAILDAALQGTIGFGLRQARRPLFLPFAIEFVDVFAPSPARGVACIRERAGAAGARIFDLDLCDGAGNVCVRLSGLTARPMSGAHDEPAVTTLWAPAWQVQPLPTRVASTSADRSHTLFYAPAGTPHAALFQACRDRLASAREAHLVVLDGPADEQIVRVAEHLLDAVQQMLRAKTRGPVRCQVVLPADGIGWLPAAASALLATAQLEDPKLRGQVIGLETGVGIDRAIDVLAQEAASDATVVRYAGGERLTTRMTPLPPMAAPPLPWKAHGVYLITGGAGGLGLIFARDLARRAASPVIVLAGRSSLDEARIAELRALEAAGARVEYHRVDVSVKADVEALIAGILVQWGRLDGVLHAAGVLQDSFLVKKTAEELRTVLRPKTAAVVHLDEATRQCALECFVVFSSASAVLGAIGQADYALANAFLDRFAERRHAQVAAGERQGRTLAIDWPWWQDGGMQIGAASVASMTRRGIRPLATADGLAAFDRAFAASASQVLVLAGESDRIAGLLDPPSVPATEVPIAKATDAAPDPQGLRDAAVLFLRKQFATTLQLPLNRIESHAAFDQYGIDSVLVLQLTAALEPTLGSLSKTLLFEYQTIDALAGYLLDAHRDRVATLAGSPAPAATRVAPAPAIVAPRRPRDDRRHLPAAAALPPAAVEGIAIIGVSGRYPQARGLDQFWQNLREGRDCITEIPPGRWDHARYFDADKGAPGKTYTKWGGFIDGVDEFDPLFFNLSPADAELIDPQERLFLQCAYETIEDAGYTRETLRRDRRVATDRQVGVFVGVMYEEYQFFGVQDQLLGQPRAIVGSPASIANRVSYFFNVQGPSLAVDTMCSSSLTALHLACQSLRQGDCEIALAGGVNVSIHPNKYLLLGQGRFASTTGRCRSFGADGDGYVPAEGVGAVLLKPLARALADGDQIHGVILGSAINHGGKTTGYTVPNPSAQAEVVTRALKAAGIDARAVSFVEAHGTGTSLGDPIEIAGLTRAFAAQTTDTAFCAIGSAKSTIGHAEGAAGVAALTKVLLQLRHRQLAPSLHAEVINPHIDFARTPFVLQRTAGDWRRPRIVRDGVSREYPRIAGISSFGAGGANAHVIVQEHVPAAEAATMPDTPPGPAIVVLSASSEAQLRTQAINLLAVIDARPLADADLPRIAYTLQIGREAFDHRLALLARSIAELRDRLTRWLADEEGVEELYCADVKRHREALAVFGTDEDLQETLVRGIERGRDGRLLDLWAKGLEVDWSRLYGDRHPSPISLPTYPFLRERYWVSPTPAQLPAASGARLLTKHWEPAPFVRGTATARRAVVAATPSTRGIAEEIVRRLPGSIVLDGEASWRGADVWIDVAGCGSEEASQRIDWIPPLQQWIAQEDAARRLVLCLTRGLEADRNLPINLAGASRAGLYRMLSHEYRRLRSRHVDVEPELQQPALVVDRIVAELQADSDDVEVRYREGTRARACLRDEEQTAAWLSGGDVVTPFPADQVLWITGGTRGLGAVCARHLVERHGVRQLLLSGREALPPPEEWARYERQTDRLSDKIRAVRALQAAGARVRVSSVPLTDRIALRAELDEVRRTLGPIGGVLHCAGAVDTETLAFVHKSPAAIARVWEPKVDGLEALLHVIAGEPLRFVVLFSSVSAIAPALGVGYADYAAANAYMDYLAAARADTLPIVSVQWGSWREAGFGETRSPAYRRAGLASYSNAEGLRLLDAILARRIAPVIMPVYVDGRTWRPEQLLRPPMTTEVTQVQPIAPRGPIETTTTATRATVIAATEAWLIEMVAAALKLDPERLDVEKPLHDYGVDSVMLIQLLRPIGDVLHTTLDPSALFEHPTIAAFARWLVKTHGDRLSQGSPAPPPAPPAGVTPASDAAALRPTVSVPSAESSDIAVVGLACRMPGARTLDDYWRLFAEGRSAIQRIPADREPPAGECYAGLLDRLGEFDPAAFQLSADDARAMDPQALLLLEEGLAACHHAGYLPEDLRGGRIGVFIGARSRHRPDADLLARAPHPILALGQNYLATNLSRVFDLRGPSLVVDTACSSGLVALQVAMPMLRTGQIHAALVGGVSLLDPGTLRLFERRGILSREPRFHLFDARATGAVLAEGAAMVMLKTVAQAQADGDRIYAVVKAVAVNNDGRTASPMAPSVEAQREVMREALAQAGLRPEDVAHIEVSGSGSEVSDLLELKAIESVYRAASDLPCELGSIKPNIGHPLSAEGIASFVKAVLMLHHRQRVPFLSAEQPMAHFDLDASPFRFVRVLTPSGEARCIGVNSFADGGTNAHAILAPWTAPQGGRHPLPLPERHPIDLRASTPAAAGFWMELTPAG